MENTNEIVNTVSGVWNQVTSAPGHMLVIVLLIVIGFVLKRIPAIPNAYIPFIIMLIGTVAYPLIVSPTLEQCQRFSHPHVVLVIYGFLLGFIAWVLHRIVLKKFGSYINGLLLDDTSPTPPAP